jgi:hypothetical protein
MHTYIAVSHPTMIRYLIRGRVNRLIDLIDICLWEDDAPSTRVNLQCSESRNVSGLLSPFHKLALRVPFHDQLVCSQPKCNVDGTTNSFDKIVKPSGMIVQYRFTSSAKPLITGVIAHDPVVCTLAGRPPIARTPLSAKSAESL